MGLRVSTEIESKGLVAGASTVKRSLKDVDAAMTKTEKETKKLQDRFDKAEFAVLSFEQTQEKLKRTIDDQNRVLNQHGRVLKGATSEYQRLNTTLKNAEFTRFSQGLDDIDGSADRVEKELQELERALEISNVRLLAGEKAARQYAAALKLGPGATADQARRVEELTGRLYDAERAGGGAAVQFGNIGAQIQDISVQLQGGQNPFLVLSQQIPQMIPLSLGMAGALTGIGFAALGVISGLSSAKDSLKDLEGALESADLALTTTADGMFTLSEDTIRLANTNVKLADSYINVARAQAEVAQQKAGNVLAETIQNTIKGTLGLTEALTGAKNPTEEQTRTIYELSKSFYALQQGEQLSEDQTVQFLSTLESLNPKTKEAKQKVLELRGAVANYALTQSKTNDIIRVTSEGYTALERSERNTANATKIKNAEKQKELEFLEAAFFLEDEIEKERARRAKLSTQVDQIAFGVLSPVGQLREEERLKLEVLAEYAELGAEQEKRAQELRTAVARHYSKEREDIAVAQYQKELSIAGNGFSSLSSLAEQFAGEQDSRNKTAFALQKGFAIASASANALLALSQALALPSDVSLPQKFASYAAVGAATGAVLGQLNSVKYATGGFVDGGGTGTSDSINARLSRGEFVVRESVTRRNRSALESLNSTGQMPSGSSGVTINYYGTGEVTETQGSNGDLIVTIDERINKQLPSAMAKEMGNPSSKSRTALARTSNIKRN